MASQVLLEQVLISGPFILLYFYSFMSQCNTHTREYASQAQTTEQMITTNRKTYFHICHHKFSNCMHCTAHTLRHTCAQREALAAKGACRTHRNAYYDIPKMLKQTAHHWESDKKNWKLIGFEKKRQSADEETNKLNLGRTTKRSRPKRYSFLRCTSRIFFFHSLFSQNKYFIFTWNRYKCVEQSSATSACLDIYLAHPFLPRRVPRVPFTESDSFHFFASFAQTTNINLFML